MAKTIKFNLSRYTGPSPEAILDKLPTAKAIRQEDNGWLLEAEVFGKGIELWLKSQGDNIQII